MTLGKALPAQSIPFTSADGARVMAALAKQPPIDAIEDVKFQSQDLLAALTESHSHQEELARINIELEQTNRGVIALYAELDEKAKTLERSTERLTLELAERIRLEAQLLQSQKMEAVGQLTGGVAHDFNNILMVILSNADALQEDESLEPDVLERLEEIIKATERAADLTRSLLAFSRKLPLRPQSTDINELVLATGKFLRPTLGAQIEIESVLAPDLWTVNVDRAQFESALVNLCINARDAMPEGGRLLIETSNVTLDDDYIARQAGRSSRPLCHDRRHRHRRRHSTGSAGQGVRAVLHDQGSGQGHRPRSQHGPWLRQAIGRPHRHLQRSRHRHGDQDVSAAHRRLSCQ